LQIGPLKNPKHERFAQELARGSSASSAYSVAGYRPHRQNASGLARSDAIKARVAELLARRAMVEDVSTQQALERAGVTKEAIVKELKIIGFARLDDYFHVDADGQPELDLNICSREKLAAVKSVSIKEYYDERTERTVREAKIELHDKKGALIDLARMHGMTNEKANINPTLIQIILNEDELHA
jgi:phage terminase small subunit